MASLMLAAILVCLISTSTAYDFYVGGRAGWVEGNPKESYNSWASRMRFQVNDKLVFKYKKTGDSVLVVKKEDYESCNVNSPIQKLEGGDSASFQFTRSGPFYFISGAQDRCTKGQKMIVVVMAVRGKKPLPPPPATAPTPSLQPPTSSPSPSPSSMMAPAPSPSASPTAAPTPSPSTVVSPPAETPSSGNGGDGPAGNEPATSPTPAPPPKSSSSSALTGSRVTIGTVALVLAHAFLG